MSGENQLWKAPQRQAGLSITRSRFAARRQRALLSKKQQRGSSMIEFAFVFLLALLLVIGLMELGRGVWTYTTISHAARQGARYAVAHGSENPASTNQIQTVVRSNAVGLDSSKVEVNTSWSPGITRGSTVQVQVRYNFQLVTSPLILPDTTIRLGSTSRMIIAN